MGKAPADAQHALLREACPKKDRPPLSGRVVRRLVNVGALDEKEPQGFRFRVQGSVIRVTCVDRQVQGKLIQLLLERGGMRA
jgi:hypothetical protein